MPLRYLIPSSCANEIGIVAVPSGLAYSEGMTASAPTATRSPKPLRFEGDRVTFSAGYYVIELQWVRAGVYSVAVVNEGEGVVDHAPYSDEDTARVEARRIAQALWDEATRSWLSWTQLTAKREQLRADVYRLEHGNMAAQRLARQRETDLEALETLASTAARKVMLADIDRHLAATHSQAA